MEELMKTYKTLNIGADFSPDPAGRFLTDGDGNGESFRETSLKPMIESLDSGEKLKIIIDDGVEGYGSSFLNESFGGMVKYGYIQNQDMLDVIEIIYAKEDFEFYKKKIISYITQASYNSKSYVPTPTESS